MNHQASLFTGVKRWSLLAAFVAFVSLPLNGLDAEAPQGPGGVSFTGVAKQAIPSVVSIRVKAPLKTASTAYGKDYQFDEPYDMFNDPFFQRFFGAPRRERSQPQQKFQTGQASGFIVSDDGYILTNAHVVQGAGEITVVLNDEREFPAQTIGIDPNTDIAVVKIDAAKLPYLVLGDSDELDIGQWVVAIGNPLGLQASVTAGVVSAKGRNNLDLARIEDFIQTDASINRGNSGGPLLNLNGEVIGMNTAIVTSMGGGGYMGIGFAIPSNMARHVMNELIENGSVSRGFMGVTLQQVNQDLAKAFNLDKIEGALVSDVSKGSPAEKGGVRQGDVIVEYNGKKVNNIASLRNAIALMKPGSKINLTVVRDGHKKFIPLTIGAYPSEEVQASIQESKVGIDVETLTPELAETMGYTGMRGVVITGVNPNSPAAWAGLRKGALIVAVNHQEIQNTEEFHRQIKQADAAKPVLFLVKQGEYMHFVSIKAG